MPAAPLIILVPGIAWLPGRLLGAMTRAGITPRINPCARARDGGGAVAALTEALLASPDGSVAVILPGPSLDLLGPHAPWPEAAQDAQILQLDWVDPVPPVLSALRAEAWFAEPAEEGQPSRTPIPDAAGFRPAIDLDRFTRMIGKLPLWRAQIAAVLPASPPVLLVDDPDPAILTRFGLPGFAQSPISAPDDLVSNLPELTRACAVLGIGSAALALPPTPALRSTRGPDLLAITTGRDVAPYLPVLARHMQDEGVSLIYIDHGSSDGSFELAGDLLGAGIAERHRMPASPDFSLRAQLREKQRHLERIDPRWVLHLDADEIPTHRDRARGLIDLLSQAEAGDHNAINFEEFVFLPERGVDYAGRDYVALIRRYYHFAPQPFRLIRLWRHGAGLTNLNGAGHRLEGLVSLLPESQDLRHYIALSGEAVERKYLGRIFDPEEVAQNWHSSRLRLDARALLLPALGDARLNLLPSDTQAPLSRLNPMREHFWMWEGRASDTDPAV